MVVKGKNVNVMLRGQRMCSFISKTRETKILDHVMLKTPIREVQQWALREIILSSEMG